MYLGNSDRGYTRNGEQRAEGRFLIVFSHNQYKWADENTGGDWKQFPHELGRKLYAHVCHVRMRQLGHFMMGESATLQTHKDYGKPGSAPNDLILSGTYGGDGLPCDYEDLTAESRAKLVEVPADLAEVFWKGGGHNSAGAEGPAMRDWAIKTFVRRVKRG